MAERLSLLLSFKSCTVLCNLMNCSMPGFLVHHYLPEFAQTHFHSVSDAIQLSHPLSLPSLPALNLFLVSRSLPMSQFLALFGQSSGASASASVLPMNIQGCFPLGSIVLLSLNPKGLSRIFSSTTVQKHQFFWPQPSLWSNFHTHR